MNNVKILWSHVQVQQRLQQIGQQGMDYGPCMLENDVDKELVVAMWLLLSIKAGRVGPPRTFMGFLSGTTLMLEFVKNSQL